LPLKYFHGKGLNIHQRGGRATECAGLVPLRFLAGETIFKAERNRFMSVWWFIGSFVLLFCLLMLLLEQCHDWLLDKELYPQPAKTSLADVKQLVKSGHRKEAVLRYLQKFPQVDLREAVYAVDSLR
jgi:hypothetical protein